MKIFVKNGEVFFDFTEVDLNAELNEQTLTYRRYMRDAEGSWEKTEIPQVYRLIFEPNVNVAGHDNIREFKRLLGNCLAKARCYSSIEVAPSADELYQAVACRCSVAHDTEQLEIARRKAEVKWWRLCSGGCGRCGHLVHDGDDLRCASSGDFLPMRNVPVDRGVVHYPFNLEAFPTGNCPFNINKNKEKAV